MKFQRYRPNGPWRVSYGFPKALYMKNAAATNENMITTAENKMTLTCMLAGITSNRAGKTEIKAQYYKALLFVP